MNALRAGYDANDLLCPVPDIITVYDYEARGIPIGRVAEVNLRNNHAQYIFTWYVLDPMLYFPSLASGRALRYRI